MGSETFLEILLAILLPPLGVFLRYGIGVGITPVSLCSTVAASLLAFNSIPRFFNLVAGGVLDLPAAHHPGLHPGHHLRRLRPRRLMTTTSRFRPPLWSFYRHIWSRL